MDIEAGQAFGIALAAEFRAELAVQKRTATEFALVLGITAHTAGRKLAGGSVLNAIEIAVGAQWLGFTPDVMVRRAELRLESSASAEEKEAVA